MTENQQLAVGDKAPLWVAPSSVGEINLEDCLGSIPVLLFFYPADWYNASSSELPMIEELLQITESLHLHTFGISSESPPGYKALSKQFKLDKLVLISDHGLKISHKYGLIDETGNIKRATLLLDATGIVRWLRIEEDATQPRPMVEVEKALHLAHQWNGNTPGLKDWWLARQDYMQLSRPQPLKTPAKLNMRFWGTRGSIPVSGAAHLRYGGNTSCVSLMSDTGHLFLFDCGSGARELGNMLMAKQQQLKADGADEVGLDGYVMLSHTHWDHIQGFPFFAPVFFKGNRFNILGWANCSQTLSSILAGQMEQIYFPVSLSDLPSELNFFSMQFGGSNLDGAYLTSKLLFHPLPSTAYRLELGGKIFVYATDHEPHRVVDTLPNQKLGYDVIDPNLVELAKDADILIHDAQYTMDELKTKKGWGHNSAEIAVDTATLAGVRTLVLFHHDPTHDDNMIDTILRAAHKRKAEIGNHKLEIIAAYDGLELDFNLQD